MASGVAASPFQTQKKGHPVVAHSIAKKTQKRRTTTCLRFLPHQLTQYGQDVWPQRISLAGCLGITLIIIVSQLRCSRSCSQFKKLASSLQQLLLRLQFLTPMDG
jgi:hypothetical protein